MPDTVSHPVPGSLAVRESGVPLAWRSPRRIWTPGSAVELNDGSIVWGRTKPSDRGFIEPEFRLLDEFVRLADPAASDEQILSFARSWGLLGLCSHGLPRTHDPNSIPYSLSFGLWLTGNWWCQSGLSSPEPVACWRYWARQAAALATLIAAVRAETLGAPRDWEVLWSPGPWVSGEPWDQSIAAIDGGYRYLRQRVFGQLGSQREHLAGALQTWLRLGGVQIEVSWAFSERPRVDVRNRGLFDTIGLLLVFVAGELEGFTFCHACRAPIAPRRRLGPRDRWRYCAACRTEKRPQQEASRAYHRRTAADPAFRAAEAARKREARARARSRQAAGS